MMLVMWDCHESIGYRSPAAMGRCHECCGGAWGGRLSVRDQEACCGLADGRTTHVTLLCTFFVKGVGQMATIFSGAVWSTFNRRRVSAFIRSRVGRTKNYPYDLLRQFDESVAHLRIDVKIWFANRPVPHVEECHQGVVF